MMPTSESSARSKSKSTCRNSKFKFSLAGKLLFAFSLSLPAAAYALIISSGQTSNGKPFEGSFNGAPFVLEIRNHPENPVVAVSRIQDKWASRGARVLPKSLLWQNLKEHPFLISKFESIFSWSVLKLPGKSFVAIFAMSQSGGRPGSQLGILQTTGPIPMSSGSSPEDPAINIQMQHFLVRSYENHDQKQIIDSLEREGWNLIPSQGDEWLTLIKENWTSYLFNEKDRSWSFVGFKLSIEDFN